jgi:hypothetical protein
MHHPLRKLNTFDLFSNFDALPHTDIARWLARKEPDMFLQACLDLRVHSAPTDTPEWFRDLIDAVYPANSDNPTPQWVAGIKFLRTQTGLGLKEAKDAIDTFRNMPESTPSYRGLEGTTWGLNLIRWNNGDFL